MNLKDQDVELTAIKAAASLTKTPFKTAFLATLGVAAAQLILMALFVLGAFVVAALVYNFMK